MRRQIYTLILILGVMLLFPLSGTGGNKRYPYRAALRLGEKRQACIFLS